MKVYNLTEQPLVYKGKTIPAGAFLEYDIQFIPDRDKMLEVSKVLAFGSLPKWFITKMEEKAKPKQEKKELSQLPMALRELPKPSSSGSKKLLKNKKAAESEKE